MSDNYPDNLITSQPDNGDFCAVTVPSDPGVKLTLEQLLSVFGGADRLGAERDLLGRLALGGSSSADTGMDEPR